MIKEIILKIDLKDVNYLNEILEFQPTWQYYSEVSCNPSEFGRIVLKNLILKFYCLPLQPERLNPEDAKCVCDSPNCENK